MNCIEYRQLITSDPGHRGAEAAEHRLSCESCTAFFNSMHEQQEKLRRAMRLQPPADLESRVMLAASSQPSNRARWYSIAAGALVGLALSVTLVMRDNSPESLQEQVIAHIYHEPNLLVPTVDVVAQTRLTDVLKKAGVRLTGDASDVSYAGLCYFRGQLVPHMVVQTSGAPVTVLVLPQQELDEPVVIDEQGFVGTIVPVRGGSIAIVGDEERTTQAVERRLVSSMEWQI